MPQGSYARQIRAQPTGNLAAPVGELHRAVPISAVAQWMGWVGVLLGARQIWFEGLLDQHHEGELNQTDAAEMLSISERNSVAAATKLRRFMCVNQIQMPTPLPFTNVTVAVGRRSGAEPLHSAAPVRRTIYGPY
jgi:hypothetical protein